MRLICVNNKPTPNTWNFSESLALIKEGGEYVGRPDYGYDKKITVVEAWRIDGIDYVYAAFRFIPLSDIDEMQLVNTKEEEYA